MTSKTSMTLKSWASTVILVGALGTPSAAQAAIYTEVINGGTCTPYPATQTPPNAVSYQHYLYGFRGSASCHLSMPKPWSVQYLKYVFFAAQAASSVTSPLTARLCVHSGTLSVTCGPANVVTSGTTVAWLNPPSSVSPSPVGAFVHFSFPGNQFWIIHYVFPIWEN